MKSNSYINILKSVIVHTIPANHPGFPGNIPGFQHRFRPIFSTPDSLALVLSVVYGLFPPSISRDAIPTSVLWSLAGMTYLHLKDGFQM